ncbi:hypothetical protein [Ornithinibacillus halophilus]|uniref:DUF8042 domain-containing protein n=1 Tax=Ornithinibacillus halophilus TaxID=930117 RepID=A0A1M5FFV9_9BACI|nr:hypothetical protein [Ornithinibacillus halophilus]SHF90368.1 hypothetical protein SAMN05216225_100871 [Ornithinibacillus halophilus]
MEKYIDMMHQSKNLQDTVQEGLEHIQFLLKEGKGEATIQLFGDIVQAFITIEKSLQVIPSEVTSTEIHELTSKIKESLELIVSCYEDENYVKIQEVLQFNTIPQFTKRKELLDKAFQPYLVS